MRKEKKIDWHQMTGELDFNMTNDFLFRALMQEENRALSALAASLMGWEESDVRSAHIENPIELRGIIDSKEFILDVKVLLNTNVIVNLELQVINLGNWPERSLSYLCRSFDNLNRGDNYGEVKPVYQIGITDFSPIEGNDHFFSKYMFQETENHCLYSDKIGLFVLDLTRLDSSTETDRKCKRDLWAKMFKARTSEELKMFAEKDPAIDAAVGQVSKITRDEMLRQRMEAREEYYRIERTNQKIMENLKTENTDLKTENTDLKTENTDLKTRNVDLESENLRLKAELARYKGKSQES